MKIRRRILARKAVKDPPLVVPLNPATQLKPERHEESQECCVSFASLSQLSSDSAVEPAKSLLQRLVIKSHCDFLMDGFVDAQRATEAGE